MIGILVQLLISWVLAWFIEKENLSVLGFRPTATRGRDFFLFLVVTAAIAAGGFFMRMYYGERWLLNPVLSISLFMEGLWWNIKSVMFEELIFRGVIMYILVKRIGAGKAIIISAIAFGIYHWFSYEIFNNPGQMAIIFLITGAAGLLYAYAYVKSGSLYIPVAIHLGWNFTSNFIFSDGKIGDGVFIKTAAAYQAQVSYFIYFVVIYLPMLTMMLINWFIIKRLKREGVK